MNTKNSANNEKRANVPEGLTLDFCEIYCHGCGAAMDTVHPQYGHQCKDCIEWQEEQNAINQQINDEHQEPDCLGG